MSTTLDFEYHYVMHEYLYWICFGAVVLYAWFDKENMAKSAKYCLYIPLFLLLSFTMVHTVAQFDIAAYRRIFNRLVESPGEWRIDMFPEYGYQYLNYVFNGVLGWNFEQFRFLYGFVVLTILFFSVSLLTKRQGLFFLLYYPKYYLIGLISHSRSAFVNPFVFVAIYMAARGQYLRIALMSFALMQIHFSAVLLNGISILSKIKLRQIYVLGVIPFSVIFSQFLLPSMIDMFSIIDIRQLNYLMADEEVQRGMFGIEFFRRAALILVCAYIVAYRKVTNETESLVIKVFVVSIFFYIGFHEARFISDRVGGMLGFVEPMMWLIFINNHLNAKNRIVATFIVIFYAVIDFLMRAIYIGGLPGHPDVLKFFSAFGNLNTY